MELSEARRRRRMVRAFSPDPLAPAVVDELLDGARRAPSAGNSQGARFLVLDDVASRSAFWDLTLPEPKRGDFAFPGLLRAPVLVLVMVDPESYLARYSEPDKAASGLGAGLDAWTVPYWWVDGGAVVQNLLLAAVDADLGACLFGLFGAERRVLDAFGVPAGWRAVGAVALGRPEPDRAGRSAGRLRAPLNSVMRRRGWDT